MVSDALPAASTLLSTLGLWAAILLSVVLLAQALPVESPLFLGASIAVVYWIVKTYVATDDG
ncbi:hypothetical protein B4589_003175 [Halolamina sp. CBA1230]|uniref:hypothetical protein n=1 Tax=Halolamina sp. CBA1230 TaxID=1853690 RepID=UPI0009A1566F|nr:hypothetical protein [Halolamina sp. CBA1230]QKY19427.1 hypothetical protein B4589_003175 [Halolamina sp. CBA1230]